MNPLLVFTLGATLLALLVSIVALRGSQPSRLADVPLPLRRARLHYAVLALTWLLALVALAAALLFPVPAERLLLVALAGHGGLLIVSLGFAAALYAPPTEAP